MLDLHRCYRGARCAHREPDPDHPTIKRGAPINAAERLCDACTRHLRQAIVDMPQDYLDLEAVLGGTRDGLRQLVSGTRDLPVPLSLTIAAVQAELVHEAQCWAESTADVLGVWWDTQAARDSRPGAVLERAAHLLENAVSVLLALRGVVHTGWTDREWTTLDRDGLDSADVLLDLHHRVEAVTGQRRLINRLPAPCPRCDRVALQRPDGAATNTCAACGDAFTWDEYQRLCTLVADRQEVLV
ncbi:hypothetical protein [Amycolatopsis sp. BJA-103]|uniref:hypothetical protein n=1 Tax=Amycolatopsis sp. BJA-103 TaxID=1911175 RepID=UPI000C75FFCF|nr:hypothetical protein [Amycolatopsis sp. BJA-103]AUI58985.1 hypothetical protein BKN51_12700 [Amycolatopsis sp. BJA-103]PNE17565.1 hypothetical protein B1H26_21865 [Amycolatopsis sp. BJA-103]